MLTIILLMALHPEIQKKAQEEIDSITGNLRMVSLGDQQDMSYIQAMLKEVARWHVVAPMGMLCYEELSKCKHYSA